MCLRAFLSITLLLSAFRFCYSQQNQIDSLENLIKTTPADTTKVWLLNKLVTTIREGDNNKAIQYAQQARELAEVLSYKRGLGSALENLGWLHYRRGNYSKAFELATEALRISETFNDQAAIARCLNSVAAINFEQKQYDLAITNFRKAHALGKKINDYTLIARSLNNIAYNMMHLEQIDSAGIYAERAIKASERTNNHYYLKGFALRTLGDIDVRHKMYDEALQKFGEAASMADKIDNKFLKISTLHRIGKTYFLINQPDTALRYLLDNIEIAKKYGYSDELESALKITAEVYASKKDIQKAYEYKSYYSQLHDSLYSQRNSEHLALMQARFESQLKEAEIQLLKKDAQLKQQEINSQQLWMYFTIGLLLLTGILVFVLLYSNWMKKKANSLLGVKNLRIQAQAQQLSNLNVTKDKLFSIISHDIRGPLASLRGLINIICKGQMSQEEFIQHSVKLRQNLDFVQDDLDNLLHWSQSQLYGLQINAEEFQIRSVVNDKITLFKEAAAKKDITIINDIQEGLTAFADKNHFSLIIRNLMANAIKFNTHGGVIRINEKIVDDRVEISVTDSGVGIHSRDMNKLFNAQTHFSNLGTDQEKGTGIGLLLTKEFIEKSGGSIWVTSEVGKGSTFTFTTKRTRTIKKEEALSSSL
jgi:two-component system, sensor histidine kinase and response regulator